jgi:DNA-binding XRE family transcriptional regulator
MSGTIRFGLVGFRKATLEALGVVLRSGGFRSWTWEEFAAMPEEQRIGSVPVCALPRETAHMHMWVRYIMTDGRRQAPIQYVSGRSGGILPTDPLSVMLQEARIPVETGVHHLRHRIAALARTTPEKVMTGIQLVTSGLRVHFADGADLTIPLNVMRRLVDDEVRWDAVGIAGDRSYLECALKDGGYIPLPWDVLREHGGAPVGMAVDDTTARMIGGRIAARRRSNGLTQRQLAEQCGVSRHSVLRLEGGHALPKVALLQSVANVLHCSMSDLLPG